MTKYTSQLSDDVMDGRFQFTNISEEKAGPLDYSERKNFHGILLKSFKYSTSKVPGRTLLSPLTLLFLAACGGGGGTKTEGSSAGQAESSSFSGKVIKGLLENAFVFADRNANGVYDPGEPNSITDRSGQFTLEGVGSATIIAKTRANTIDQSTGASIEGLTLSAPAGASVVTPFTTVISQTNGTLTATQVSRILGLPDGVDILSFDPFSVGVNTADAARVEIVAHQLIATVRGYAAVAEGVGASEAEAMTAAFGAIVELIVRKHSDGAGRVDFASIDDMSAISELLYNNLLSLEAQSNKDLNFEVLESLSESISTAILNVNSEIDEKITQIISANGSLESNEAKAAFSTTQALQAQIVAAVESEALNEGSGSALIEFTNVEKVSDAVLNAIPSSLSLSNDVVIENDTDLRVGTLSAQDDAILPTDAFSIVEAGDHWQHFEIVNSNELRLKVAADFEDIAVFNILIDVTDVGGKALRQAFTISVVDVDDPDPIFQNSAPLITSAAPLSVTKGNTYIYNLALSDPDTGDQLAVTATKLPDWLSFNPETLSLTGTPTGDNLGPSEVTLEVSDGALATSQSFVIDVNNTIGSVIVLIDQFSDRIFQLGHQNLTLFDYGTLSTVRSYDYEGNGYTRYDYISGDQDEGFYQISYDTESSVYPETLNAATTNLFDYDYITSGSVDDLDAGSYDYDDYSVFNRLNQTSDSHVNRGDWALAALLQQLENAEKTAIIAIDLDTLSGADSHYQKLFDVASFSVPESGVVEGTALEQIIFDWLSANDYRFTGNNNHSDYLVSALSVSILGTPESLEFTTLDFLASLQAPIVQAVPNSTQGVHDWGSNYTDVITVGAWNKDESGNLLISSEANLEAVDILADGIVSQEGWGTNFDPAFAAPRVTAEITNLINNIIQYLESEGTALAVAQQDSVELEIYYADLINSVLDSVGTSVSFDIEDGVSIESFEKIVLSSDLISSKEPGVVSPPVNEEFAWGAITNIEVLTSDSVTV